VNDAQHALISEAQDGNVRAFELLVASHLSRVRRFARAFALSDADGDDLAQEALVKAYKNLRSYRFQSSFETWLHAVVRNAFLDAVRSRAGRERAQEEPLTVDHGQVASEGVPADEGLSRAEERTHLWRAIQALPTEFRSAIVLFDVEGHPYEEVAAIEGVPVGTVKSRLSRGRALLRGILSGGSGAPPSSNAPGAGTSTRNVPSNVRRSGK